MQSLIIPLPEITFNIGCRRAGFCHGQKDKIIIIKKRQEGAMHEI